MQKLKYSVIDRLKEDATNKEISFLFHVGQLQNNRGEVFGVYYSKVCKAINCSVQTFYNIMESLQEKKIIEVIGRTDFDCDIRIVGNSFEEEDYTCGYLSLRRAIFRSTAFAELKAKEKLILVDLLIILSSNGGVWRINRYRLYKRYQDMFGVSLKAVWGYLRTIRRCMGHIIKVGCSNFEFIFVLQRGGERKVESESDDMKVNENAAECILRRNRIRGSGQEDITRLAQLMRQYARLAGEAGKDIFQVAAQSVAKYLDGINRYLLPKEKRDYSIQYKLLHKIIRGQIGLDPGMAD